MIRRRVHRMRACATTALLGVVLSVASPGEVAGDANHDGAVDAADLELVLILYGHLFSDGDVNGDGIVDFDDILLVLTNWTA